MSSLKDIKRRIESVDSISQVTSAMQLVAASRMRKAEENAEKGKLYAHRIREIMKNLSFYGDTNISPFINPEYSNSKNLVFIVFSPQRGLAGSLPSNLMRFIDGRVEDFKSMGYEIEFVTIGKKIRDQIVRQKKNIIADFSDIPEFPTTSDIQPILTLVTEKYIDRQISGVYVVYAEFVNSLTQLPRIQKLLPFDSKDLDNEEEEEIKEVSYKPYVFEPSAAGILHSLIPNYIETQLFQKRLETIASEYSSRMVAMKSATDNAHGILDDLNIEYNKRRQAAITKELAEINAGRD